MSKEGLLTIVIKSAELERDTDLLSKMDPYCMMYYEKREFRTPTRDEAGKQPVWNYEQSFQVSSAKNLKF